MADKHPEWVGGKRPTDGLVEPLGLPQRPATPIRGRPHEEVAGRALGPFDGHWHVTVDMAGLRGTVRSSVRTLPAALPEARLSTTANAHSAVRDIGENLADIIGGADRDFDVFVSHASPDKDGFVRPFAEALESHGLQVWFDEFVLTPGSSLRRSIDDGIRKARYAIVVLSPAFLTGRPWTEHELDGLVGHRSRGCRLHQRGELMEPAPNLIEAISASLLDESCSVVSVSAVRVAPERRNEHHWPELMVAAAIDDGGTAVEAVFATGALGGPTFAVNAAAREYTPWGAAATGGSRADDVRNAMLTYPEVEASLRVLLGT